MTMADRINIKIIPGENKPSITAPSMYINAPEDIRRNFVLIDPVDLIPLLRNPNPTKIRSDNKNAIAAIPATDSKTRLSLIKFSPAIAGSTYVTEPDKSRKRNNSKIIPRIM